MYYYYNESAIGTYTYIQFVSPDDELTSQNI